jgi:hypothetical protein
MVHRTKHVLDAIDICMEACHHAAASALSKPPTRARARLDPMARPHLTSDSRHTVHSDHVWTNLFSCVFCRPMSVHYRVVCGGGGTRHVECNGLTRSCTENATQDASRSEATWMAEPALGFDGITVGQQHGFQACHLPCGYGALLGEEIVS